MRYKCLIEYVGHRFKGWQLQKDKHVTTVAGTLERALSGANAGRMSGPWVAAGRTDAGVHALGQVAHVDFESFQREGPLSGESLAHVINGRLGRHSDAVRVLRCEQVSDEYHARFSCTARNYVYRVRASRARNHARSRVFDEKRMWLVDNELDLQAMQQTVQVLSGTHDFSAFQAAGGGKEDTVRQLQLSMATEVSDSEQHILFSLRQSSFLYRQVRRIIGMLVKVGLRENSIDDVNHLLTEHERSEKKNENVFTAPPQGLYFAKAEY